MCVYYGCTLVVLCPVHAIQVASTVFSERNMLSPVRLSSVTLVRPQTVQIFGNISTPLPSLDIYGKIYGDRPRSVSASGALNARGVAKYSDFGPIEGYISETVAR